MKKTIILGIDPGSRITGFGVISTTGSRHAFLGCGCIKTQGDCMAQRLHQIYTGLCEVISTYQPNEASIEQVFMNKNANSALKLGQARGVALVALATHGLSIAEYSPRSIKQAIVGHGGAEKQQVQHMIKVLLNLEKTPQADAADALAIAVCHANSRGINARLATMGVMA
jgi:crossover junction endodeoxyribonuclease RuvC